MKRIATRFAVFFIIISLFIFIFLISIYTIQNKKTVVASTLTSESKTIIIDPGHGGEDGGAVSSDGTVEKDINLSISMKLSKILNFYGYNVILTRNGDYSIYDKNLSTIRDKKISDIHNREKIIKNNPDAIFISIHQNKYTSSSARGTQVFYSGNNEKSISLAEKVQASVVSNLQKNNFRNIKKSGTEIYLLYHSKIPSIMVECGFISNTEELNLLKDEKYQTQISQSIANGIIEFLIEQDDK